MTPMFFAGHNHVFLPPKEWDTAKGDCGSLPVMGVGVCPAAALLMSA